MLTPSPCMPHPDFWQDQGVTRSCWWSDQLITGLSQCFISNGRLFLNHCEGWSKSVLGAFLHAIYARSAEAVYFGKSVLTDFKVQILDKTRNPGSNGNNLTKCPVWSYESGTGQVLGNQVELNPKCDWP